MTSPPLPRNKVVIQATSARQRACRRHEGHQLVDKSISYPRFVISFFLLFPPSFPQIFSPPPLSLFPHLSRFLKNEQNLSLLDTNLPARTKT